MMFVMNMRSGIVLLLVWCVANPAVMSFAEEAGASRADVHTGVCGTSSTTGPTTCLLQLRANVDRKNGELKSGSAVNEAGHEENSFLNTKDGRTTRDVDMHTTSSKAAPAPEEEKTPPQEAAAEKAAEDTINAAEEQIEKITKEVEGKFRHFEGSPLGTLKRCMRVKSGYGFVWTEVFKDLQPPLRLVVDVNAPEAHLFLSTAEEEHEGANPNSTNPMGGWGVRPEDQAGQGYQVSLPGDPAVFGNTATRVCVGTGRSRCRPGDGPFRADEAYPEKARRIGGNESVKFLLTTDYVFKTDKHQAREAVLNISEYHDKNTISLVNAVSLERGNLTRLSVMSRSGRGTWRICEVDNTAARKELEENRITERKALEKYVDGDKEIAAMPSTKEEKGGENADKKEEKPEKKENKKK